MLAAPFEHHALYHTRAELASLLERFPDRVGLVISLRSASQTARTAAA